MTLDWEEIKHEYLSERISLNELARRHGLKYTAVKYHSTKEGWGMQRGAARAEETSRRVEQASIKLLKRLERTIDEDGDIKDIKAMTGALKELRDIQQRAETEQDENGRQLEVRFVGDSGELSK